MLFQCHLLLSFEPRLTSTFARFCQEQACEQFLPREVQRTQRSCPLCKVLDWFPDTSKREEDNEDIWILNICCENAIVKVEKTVTPEQVAVAAAVDAGEWKKMAARQHRRRAFCEGNGK